MKKRNHKNGKRKPSHLVNSEPSYPTLPQRIEDALINGNLATLTPEERVQLYMQTCKSLKLNPMTKPFGYILMKDYGDNEKLILYATRNCTDQLRSVYGASDVPGSLKREQTSTELSAEIAVVGRNGRMSQDVGVIPMVRYVRGGGSYLLTDKGRERDLANAKMHVVTKARRRATLALYGLGGIVDESELDTMQVVGGVTKEGRIWRYAVQPPPPPRELVDGGDYPRGPKSDLAAAQLRKVEELDKEFASGVATPSAAKAPASKPTQSAPAGHAGTGLAPRQPAQGAKAEGGSPKPPSPTGTPQGTTVAANRPLAGERKPEGRSTPPPNPANRPVTRNPVAQARIPHKIAEVKRTGGQGKGIEVTLDTGHRMYTFDNRKMDEDGTRLFDILLKSAGKEVIFTTKLEKNYMHIDQVIKIGDREWEDGVPVLRREPATKREPGEDSKEDW